MHSVTEPSKRLNERSEMQIPIYLVDEYNAMEDESMQLFTNNLTHSSTNMYGLSLLWRRSKENISHIQKSLGNRRNYAVEPLSWEWVQMDPFMADIS